jgi:hypothetical protein
MRKLLIAVTAASVALPVASPGPALAQRHDRNDQWQRTRDWNHARNYDWNRAEPGYTTYYPDRYYRPGPVYVMRRGDRIYRGHDGRYYCRRSNGTTGLIVGATLGAALGSQVRVGGSQTLSAILGGAAGAALGQSVDRGRLRCR